MDIEDEYGLGEILKEHGMYSVPVVSALNEHLDKVIGIYITDMDGHKQSMATEISCFLLCALNETRGAEDLAARIKKLAEDYAPN